MRSAYCLHSWRRPQLIHSADGSRVESSAAPTLIKKEDEGVVERTKFHLFCLSISAKEKRIDWIADSNLSPGEGWSYCCVIQWEVGKLMDGRLRQRRRDKM